jgi:hypothetical protein
VGDTVRISTDKLGTLMNRVTTSKLSPPWTFGLGALMHNLAGRGLLKAVRLAYSGNAEWVFRRSLIRRLQLPE